jgi:NNP family nitrate/nitrite transporter-like MFS transporter
MESGRPATRIELTSFSTPQMRAFHMTWLAFFVCFFGWFGIAPLMAIVREDLELTPGQVGNTMIASVAITVLARLFVGPLCDRYGARRVYSWLLVVGAFPVLGIGLASSYETFLLFRLAIGALGASFVVTQYHTSVMFAPNCVGTANATTAGWGNLGGGVAQMAMPALLLTIGSLGISPAAGWRLAMVAPGMALLLMGLAYRRFTQDTPGGNYGPPPTQRPRPAAGGRRARPFLLAARDPRVWALFVTYAACFGVELTLNNIAALYYRDHFGLDVGTAGLAAGLFGLMNIFARTLGGALSDRCAVRGGLGRRVWFLGGVLLAEGLALIVFSRMTVLPLALVTMMIFSLFVQMAEGATYAVVPFVRKEALGAVAGIVGAGGNAGAVAAGFLFRSTQLGTADALLVLGIAVAASSVCAFAVRFAPARQAEERLALARAIAERRRGEAPVAMA